MIHTVLTSIQRDSPKQRIGQEGNADECVVDVVKIDKAMIEYMTERIDFVFISGRKRVDELVKYVVDYK